MATYIEGTQTTGNVLAFEKRIDVEPEVFFLEKDLTPVLHISAGGGATGLPAKKRVVDNSTFNILEKENRARWVAVSATYTPGIVTFTVNSAAGLSLGDVLKAGIAQEVVYVTAKTTNTITVTRAFGQTAAATLAASEPLLRLGNIKQENAVTGTPLMVQNRQRINYTGIFRKAWGLSGTAQKTKYWTGDKEKELNQEALLEFKRDIEYAFKFGEPYTGTAADGNPIRNTGGLYYWGTTGGGTVVTATTTFTKSGWVSFTRQCFEKGDSMTRVAICSPLVIEMLEYWKDTKLQFRPSDQAYDLRVAEYESGNGTLLIVRDRSFENSPVGTTTAGYGGMCIVFDPKLIKYVHMEDRDAHVLTNVVRDGRDGYLNELLGEIGIEVINPENIGILKGVATYS